MTGSLQEKRGTFYMVLNLYENGKRKQQWVATGIPIKGGKRKAEQMLRDKIQELEALPQYSQYQIDQRSSTFANYIRYWLTLAKRRVDPVTYQGYKMLADEHILPYFDERGTLLQDMNVELLQAYVDEKSTNGRKDGKGGLSPRSVQMHRNIIHQTVEEAIKNGLLAHDICHFLVMPKAQRYQSTFYTPQQLQTLFDAIHAEAIGPLVKITALYGLRRSEVLGLKWDSVNFEQNTLTIQHTVVCMRELVRKDTTKTASSHRSFPLLPEAKEIFQKAKLEEMKNRQLFGKQYHVNEYIFKWPDGRPFHPDYVSQRFAKVLKKHALPHIRFHELRHSCASLLLSKGFTLKDVQEWMGHADIQMTANIYGHLDLARKQEMADKVSATLIC